jgi:hypothetical protein
MLWGDSIHQGSMTKKAGLKLKELVTNESHRPLNLECHSWCNVGNSQVLNYEIGLNFPCMVSGCLFKGHVIWPIGGLASPEQTPRQKSVALTKSTDFMFNSGIGENTTVSVSVVYVGSIKPGI